MKNLLTVFSLFLVAYTVSAQELKLNDPLPVNQKIKKGVLKNGLTYYIYKTDVIKNVASYYIIQNVGSILENDDQQGLAHFLEHMAFNGTKNFPGKGVLNTLQKHGAVFAKDINAYTAFDETVYNMDNIPTNVDGLIDTSLLILHDWADGLLLTDAEIDAERGVIKEEWRSRQNGDMRLFKNSLPTMFNNTKYAERMPIGLMSVIDNFKYKALRDFYHDWYRTDLQAIAVVGDIDVEEIEQKIEKLFAKIPAIQNPIERVVVNIPDNAAMLYNLGMDKEITTSNISFTINQPKSLKDETVADLKEALFNKMVSSMLSSRLKEIAQKPDASFVSASCSYQSLARAKNSFGLMIYPKPNRQQQAFKTALEELNRAVKFGFTQAEIDRTIAVYSNYYQTKISKIDQTPHFEIINSIQKNYLENETMTDLAKEYELVKNIFAQLAPKDLHDFLKKLYTAENRVLDVTGVEGDNNLSREEALTIINNVEKDTALTAYTDAFVGETLTSGIEIKEGKIVSEKNNKEINATTFVLSNGMVVNYKFTDIEKNNVLFEAASFGGNSLLKDADLPSAAMVSNLVGMSGLGDYNSTDLAKVLAGKSAKSRISISELEETISGMSTTKDVETMLQMLHLQFVKPRFDEDSFKVLQNNLENSLIRRKGDIAYKMEDSVSTILYGFDNPKKRLFDEKYLKDISFEKIKSIYQDRFNNAADFVFFITGDVSKEVLKPLLEKYLASLPTTKKKEKWQDNSVTWLNDTNKKDVFLPMEDPKATVRIAFKNKFKYSLKNTYLLKAFQDILELRLMETLREQEGGTYGASVYSSLSKRPKESASFYVYFDCNPDKVDKLVSIVHQEIDKIKNGTIDKEDLDKALISYLKDVKEQKEYTGYQMNLLYDYFIEGYNRDEAKNNVDLINAIKPQDIQKFVQLMMNNSQSFEIVFKPAK
ncbi:M16 family metallopeptidase [Flavobacterium granuli]|uniref:Zinc protease n=1 Tax=Flavobacterium granuli TaxID=280093 RepID=A0A1M5IY66_9FLAO|nr:M16 family metallopeptidase [Flavobacterium granuli]PRZ28152.1 zinc protease [Flavobacterium granuli]SHG33075.1 zinc protease [Flavobacterium granuli]